MGVLSVTDPGFLLFDNNLNDIDMKKIAYGVALTVGFLLMVSESATMLPNMLGLAAFSIAAYKLDIIESFKQR